LTHRHTPTPTRTLRRRKSHPAYSARRILPNLTQLLDRLPESLLVYVSPDTLLTAQKHRGEHHHSADNSDSICNPPQAHLLRARESPTTQQPNQPCNRRLVRLLLSGRALMRSGDKFRETRIAMQRLQVGVLFDPFQCCSVHPMLHRLPKQVESAVAIAVQRYPCR